jgi:hypothetical protein
MTTELTYEEFCSAPLTYTLGMVGDWGAQRQYSNAELGIRREMVTRRKRYGDIYSGWREPKIAYFLNNDPRQFANSAELYEAWMARVCGVEAEA